MKILRQAWIKSGCIMIMAATLAGCQTTTTASSSGSKAGNNIIPQYVPAPVFNGRTDAVTLHETLQYRAASPVEQRIDITAAGTLRQPDGSILEFPGTSLPVTSTIEQIGNDRLAVGMRLKNFTIHDRDFTVDATIVQEITTGGETLGKPQLRITNPGPPKLRPLLEEAMKNSVNSMPIFFTGPIQPGMKLTRQTSNMNSLKLEYDTHCIYRGMLNRNGRDLVHCTVNQEIPIGPIFATVEGYQLIDRHSGMAMEIAYKTSLGDPKFPDFITRITSLD